MKRDDILADYRAGYTIREVAKRNEVSHSTVSKTVGDAGLTRRKGPPKRGIRCCSCCGIPTLAKKGVCRTCKTVSNAQPKPSDALRDGAWVLHPRRRVLVWQEAS
jgi:hypothetical protein